MSLSLLAALHPSGFRDLRAFYADRRAGPVTTLGVSADIPDLVDAFTLKYKDRDLYVGVAPRISADSRDAEGCTALYALFTDLDYKDSSEAVCREKLAGFPLRPSCIIRSGGGLQVYWFLREPLDLRADYAFAKMLLVSLASHLGGDLHSAEPARILRIPGTINYKYDPPRPVELELIEDLRYPVTEFLACLPIIQPDSSTTQSDPISHNLSRDTRMRLARHWLERQPPAIENKGGDAHTYSTCCSVAHGHDLSPADAFEVLHDWNARCHPPWAENALRQKIRSALKSADGPRGERLQLVLSHADPLGAARTFTLRHYFPEDTLGLRHQSSVFYGYVEGAGAYHERDEPAVRADLYTYLDGAQVVKIAQNVSTLVPYNPTKSKVENVLDALRAVCNLPSSIAAPTWLGTDSQFSPLDMLASPNGLLHIPTRTFHPKTPHFYTMNGIEFAYDPWAPEPVEWLKFLDSQWADDPESVTCLQEIFGYLLTPDTKLQKILMLIGDKRSGKGIIGRVARLLVGERNTCSPTLSAFGQQFGKQALIGKTLAIISDARIGGHTDTAMVAEALLSISGEDAQSIPRKFLNDWTGTIRARFLVLTNELPRIADVSGALASRFIIIHLKRSFLGKEDLGLFDRLVPELPGILKWALDGRDRLAARGHLLQPKSSDDLIEEFGDLGSPCTAFLRDHTVRQPGALVSQRDLFAAWQTWCATQGRDKPGTAQSFGRDVRAALPWATARKLGASGEQERFWEGIGLVSQPSRPGL